VITTREFLKTMSAAGCAATFPGCTSRRGNEIRVAGFRGFVMALASARVRAGDGCRVTLGVREECLLAGWNDDDRIRIVETGRPFVTRGIGMEFMLRMEVMGPIASTPHPRPGQPWEPTLRVGDVRRLMRRMLGESGVEVVYGRTATPPCADPRAVPGRLFVEGQSAGTAHALAARENLPLGQILQSEEFRMRLARDLSLPG